MTTYNEKSEDNKGRQIKPVLFNTAKDGSGTFLFPVVDENGKTIPAPAAIGTPVPFSATCGVASAVLVAANASREYLLIQNDSDTVMYFAKGTAAALNAGIRLASGGSYVMSRLLGNLSTDAIYGINAVGDKNVCGEEV